MYSFGPPRPLSDVLHRKMVREVSGDRFAGTSVVIAPGGDFDNEQEIAPAHDLLTRLANLPLEERKQKQQRDKLRSALYAATMEAQAFVDAVVESRNKALKLQLEEIRSRGRQQEAVISKLESNRQALEFEFHSARNHAQNCRDVLADLHNTRFSRWASEEDRKALAKKISAAEVALREANEDYARAQAAHNEAANDVGSAQARMGEISDTEIRLRGELSGKVYRDPQTALPVVPQ